MRAYFSFLMERGSFGICIFFTYLGNKSRIPVLSLFHKKKSGVTGAFLHIYCLFYKKTSLHGKGWNVYRTFVSVGVHSMLYLYENIECTLSLSLFVHTSAKFKKGCFCMAFFCLSHYFFLIPHFHNRSYSARVRRRNEPCWGAFTPWMSTGSRNPRRWASV